MDEKTWRNFLNEHPIFDEIRQANANQRVPTESLDILAVEDGEVFVWNASTANILTANLKNFVQKNDRSAHFQTLICNNAPVFNVSSLLFNQTGHQVALVGSCGISVVQLPRHCGKHAEFEGGKPKISCKTIPVAERFFLTNDRVRVLHAAWHPGSETGQHLVVLTSDDTIRIYNINEPQHADQTFHLSDLPLNVTTAVSRSVFAEVSMGEIAVSFDFGPPHDIKLSSLSKAKTEIAWPIYILKGNGDVYSLNTSVNARGIKSKVTGPLAMHPPAEDNYGVDACSIRCIHSSPPVIVIATCSGNLHHCILLSGDQNDDVSSSFFNAGSNSTLAFDDTSEAVMYVYETVELELSLTTVAIETDEVVDNDFNCPITLHKDVATLHRYHCSHSSGVHTVVLPWLPKFEEFCQLDAQDVMSQLGQQEEAIVEHLVCTKPMSTSAPSPILGLCMTVEHLLGATLMCLTSSYDCIALPLLSSHRGVPPPLLSSSPSKRALSPLRALQKEPFNQHIAKILKRNASNPILKTDSNTDLSPQECFQLLTRASQVFREEYIQKHDLAREEIERRVRILKQQKEVQQSDLEYCKVMKDELTDSARNLAEKYEDALDRQQAIVSRVDNILRKVQLKLPVLSDAERTMQRDLKTMDTKLKHFKNSIEQIKIKQDYQRRQISQQQRQDSRGQHGSPVMSKSQTQQLKKVLMEESEQISNLVKQVNEIKMAVNG
ncbi:unnamed protein product [Owenia fusiformis]|uniref:Nuclear pore complex protein Nup88 n=1 Tax=Owenia fusiformis TaxID=6347 RepID=A0A8S4Q3C1_OWEFU|nr:unnamed protein product [Owenia fusiformis]